MKKLIMAVMVIVFTAYTAYTAKAEDKTVTAERPAITEKKAVSIININTATELEFQSLDRVGKKRAERIVEHRKANGNFKSIEDLMNVKGIGKGIFEKNKDRLTVK